MIIYPLFPPAVFPFRRPHLVRRARMSLRYRRYSPCHVPVIPQTTNGIHHAADAGALPGLTGALSINPLIYSSKAGREKCLENVKINAKW
jgi:hypothetical protein